MKNSMGKLLYDLRAGVRFQLLYRPAWTREAGGEERPGGDQGHRGGSRGEEDGVRAASLHCLSQAVLVMRGPSVEIWP